jgi:hypothetical protein
MAIDVEVGRAAMTATALVVRQFAQTVEIISSKKGDAVREGKALAGLNFAGNFIQLLVG